MSAKKSFSKFTSAYLWGNLLAMVLVVVGLCLGVKYGLEAYTHHGEGIEVPALVNMRADNARVLLIEKGLELMVADSGYNKRLPADCILAQSPGAGTKVKEGRIIYVTINSPSSPSFPIPDLIDNSSYREAEAKLSPLTLIIGNGQYGEDEDIDYTEPEAFDGDFTDSETDEFEEVTEPVIVGE